MSFLAERAARLEAWAETHAVDPHGVVYSQLDRATGAPPTDAFFEGSQDAAQHVAGVSPAEFWAYENCGMTTGAYLQALVCRHEVERDPAALDRARRCIAALRHIYDLGQQLGEGFFPKIYGGRFSTQTSTDQVLYAVLALDRFAPHANAAERAAIARMIAGMVRFWVKRAYRFGYYHIPDMLWPLARFPSLLLLAWRHSGDPLFMAEYERLLAEGVNRFPGESRLRRKRSGEQPPSAYETREHAWLMAHAADAVTMDIMELDVLLRHDPANAWAACWRESMRSMWDEGRLALDADGRYLVQVLVDMESGAARRPAAETSDIAKVSGATSGWGGMIARAGVQAAAHLDADRPAILAAARRALEALDIEDLTYMNDPERWPPEQRYQTRFLSGDALANWLWAYWLGRRAGYW